MSLRFRLLLATGVVVLAALAVAELVTYSSLHTYLVGQLDSRLAAAASNVRPLVEAGTKPDADLVQDSAPEMFVQERSPSGAVLGSVAARDAHASPLPPPQLPAAITALEPGDDPIHVSTETTAAGVPEYRLWASRLSSGNLLVLGVPLTSTDATLSRLLVIELVVAAGALVLALALGWLLVRVGMRPLVAVERAAEGIGAGELSARIPEPRRRSTEIGRLAHVLNTMLSRLEGAFAARDRTEHELRRSEERMRQFLADASHELRTPLAAVSAYAELFDRSIGEHPEDLPRILRGISTETGRMGHLVADLLLLANLDEGRPLERAPIELVSLAAAAVDSATAVAPGWPARLDADEPVEIVGDEARLRQVLDNLLANVRAHTPAGTAAEVHVRRRSLGAAAAGAAGGDPEAAAGEVGGDPEAPAGDREEAVIEVVDHGPGLGEDGMRRVFERFYRSEASRTRARGGAGLGLAIARAIVEAHRGTISASETPGGGATFVVVLPVG